jgi:hypothetical protein
MELAASYGKSAESEGTRFTVAVAKAPRSAKGGKIFGAAAGEERLRNALPPSQRVSRRATKRATQAMHTAAVSQPDLDRT